MDILYQHERATAADVLAALPDPPSYSSVRALLGILETKGHVTHAKDGPRYVYRPTRRPARRRPVSGGPGHADVLCRVRRADCRRPPIRLR